MFSMNKKNFLKSKLLQKLERSLGTGAFVLIV
jgi:hypothetical protein